MESAENPIKSRQNNLNIMNMSKFNFNIDELTDDINLSKNSYIDKSIKQEYADTLDICTLSEEQWKEIKDRKDCDELAKRLNRDISLSELRTLFEKPSFREMVQNNDIEVHIDLKSNDNSKAIRLIPGSGKNNTPTYIYAPLCISCHPTIHDQMLSFNIVNYINTIIINGDKTMPNLFWMSFLKNHIPVLIVPEGYIPDSENDELGCYYSYSPILRDPIILLCPQRIEAAANDIFKILQSTAEPADINICRKVLYAIVLIHEYAHAMMDYTNVLEMGNTLIDKPDFVKDGSHKKKSENEKYMEESLANMITLQYFEATDKNNIKIVEAFMEQQPTPYKFGIEQYKANVE